MTKRTFFAFILLLVNCAHAAEAPQPIKVANFSGYSEQQFKTLWQSYGFSLFGEKTRYQLVKQNNQQVLLATSKGSASGLLRNIKVDLKRHPILNWRWQTYQLPTQGDDFSKAGDDHSLRLYIIFDSPEPSLLGWLKNQTGFAKTHAINYIWANQAEINTVLPNPYSERAMMIAVNSGAPKLGLWQTLNRNVYDDYLRAFGIEPPPISAVAIMTDGDNTDSHLTSYYGDISFNAAKQE